MTSRVLEHCALSGSLSCKDLQNVGGLIGFHRPAMSAGGYSFFISRPVSPEFLSQSLRPSRCCMARAPYPLDRQSPIDRVHFAWIKPFKDGVQNFVGLVVKRLKSIGSRVFSNVSRFLCNEVCEPSGECGHGGAKLFSRLAPLRAVPVLILLCDNHGGTNGRYRADGLYPCGPIDALTNDLDRNAHDREAATILARAA